MINESAKQNMIKTEDSPGASTDLFWQQIHERLEKAHEELTRKAQPGSDETGKILHDRALVLARRDQAVSDAAGSVDMVVFLLGSETFAFDMSAVREIVTSREITPVPGTPSFVSGIANIRGQVISVIDFKYFFNIPATKQNGSISIIIIKNNAMEFGIVADGIKGILTECIASIQPPMTTLAGVKREYLRGILNGRIALLDAERILSDGTLIVDDPFESGGR